MDRMAGRRGRATVGLIFSLSLMVSPVGVTAQGFDDLTTEGINEGSIGTGFDDLTTEGINEGNIGSGFDDLTTEGVNEGRIGSGFDDLTTEGINEGNIGTGFDDLTTEGINEGAIGSGFDDLTTPGVNEGAIEPGSGNHRFGSGYTPYGSERGSDSDSRLGAYGNGRSEGSWNSPNGDYDWDRGTRTWKSQDDRYGTDTSDGDDNTTYDYWD